MIENDIVCMCICVCVCVCVCVRERECVYIKLVSDLQFHDNH